MSRNSLGIEREKKRKRFAYASFVILITYLLLLSSILRVAGRVSVTGVPSGAVRVPGSETRPAELVL